MLRNFLKIFKKSRKRFREDYRVDLSGIAIFNNFRIQVRKLAYQDLKDKRKEKPYYLQTIFAKKKT